VEEEAAIIMKKQNHQAKLSTKLETALHRYRTNQQRRTDRRNRWQWKLFKWDLFALPIICRAQTADSLSEPTIKVEDLAQNPERLILLTGAPGTGKTTACRRLIAKPPPALVPVDISKLESFNSDAVFGFLAKGLELASPAALTRIECAGRLFFVVDGIGERKDAEVVAESLRALVRQFKHSRFMVTCRTSDYDESWLPRFNRWNIQELNAELQDDFIGTQPQALQQRFQEAFTRDGRFREILSNQFLLLLATKLMAEPTTDRVELTKLGLYKAFLAGFLRDWEKIKVGQWDFILKVLQEIALEMRKGELMRNYRTEQDVAAVIRDHLSCPGASESVEKDIQDTIRELYQHGLLVKEDALVRFFQETFQEFLCARWLCDQGAFPHDFYKRGDKVYFRDLQMSDVILEFYRRMIEELLDMLQALVKASTPGAYKFDVFLSHNSKDKPVVRELKHRLNAQKLSAWYDEDELRPGIPWQQLLESGIKSSASVALLVGKDGLGPWEEEEMQGALRLAVKDKRPVIPVLLPEAPSQPELPMFLGNRTWVDLRAGFTAEGFAKLVWGITGKKL
jgi:hypothetical protein